MMDNVLDLAMNDIWPLLSPEPKRSRLGELHAAFAPALIEELRAQVPAAEVDVLLTTATARLELVTAVAAMGERTRCGSRFQVATIPWNGFNEEELESFRKGVDRGSSSCPQVTRAEADAIEDASKVLRDTPSLRPALEALSAWVTQPVVVHEARHAADLGQATTTKARTCSWCGPRDAEPTRVELSAYLAELSWTTSPALALFQVCHATANDPGVGHGEALDVILDRSDHMCSQGALPRANEVAGRLEANAFGRSDPITPLGPLPARLPVDNLRLGR